MTPKVVLLLWSTRQTVEIVEPVVGIEHGVAEVVEDRSGEAIRAGSRDERDLRAWAAAKLRREARRLDLELLQVID